MATEQLILLLSGIFLIAVLYSSIGHAGASGYIAVMSLLSIAPAVIKPTALALNILVASIATVQFVRAGHFSWPLFWPFSLLAVPLAFLGGYIPLPSYAFKVMVGLTLLYSAARFFVRTDESQTVNHPPTSIALLLGAVIGLLSGLTGTGGGIFLTPLLLWMGWARAKQAAAVSALFILVNSVAGLLGTYSAGQKMAPDLSLQLLIAALGGLIGSTIGSQQLGHATIKRFLAIALCIGGAKLVFS